MHELGENCRIRQRTGKTISKWPRSGLGLQPNMKKGDHRAKDPKPWTGHQRLPIPRTDHRGATAGGMQRPRRWESGAAGG